MGGNGTLPPGPRYLTPFGATSAALADPIGYVTHLFRDFGDVVGTRMGPLRSYAIFHPDDIKHVLPRTSPSCGSRSGPGAGSP